MNEIRRLAYLEAMDIPSYVSRRDLPGAAPSRRFRVVAPAETPADALASVAEVPAPKRPDMPASPRRPRASRSPVQRPAPERQDTPVFSVAASAAGGWLWVDEIPPGRDPGSDYAQLLAAICRALGLPAEPPSVQLFTFPAADNAALAGGLEEARQALFGFLNGRVVRGTPGRVVLLGELTAPWFDASFVQELPVTHTVSAWGMLRDPRLKARAWRDLKPLSVDVQ